jgi:Kdo2-lipid IVA lauroyltransferase/acyltransferase
LNLKRLRRRALWPFGAGLMWLVMFLCGIMPLGWLRGLAGMVGTIQWWLPRHRRLLRANLSVAFPDWPARQRDQVARASLVNLVEHYLKFLWVQRHPAHLAKLVSLPAESLATLHAAQAAGEAIILVTPHLGCWELSGLALAAAMPKVAAVARRVHNPWINGQLATARQLFGTQLIYEKGAVKGILAHLRQAGLLALLVDQNTRLSEGGLFITFFGVPATMSRAAAMFSRKLKTRLIMGAALRQADGSTRFLLHELPAATYADELSLCQAISTTTEGWVREAPEQYLWLYERWRYIPAEGGTAAAFPYYAKPYRDRRLAEVDHEVSEKKSSAGD